MIPCAETLARLNVFASRGVSSHHPLASVSPVTPDTYPVILLWRGKPWAVLVTVIGVVAVAFVIGRVSGVQIPCVRRNDVTLMEMREMSEPIIAGTPLRSPRQ